jgi:2-amino-4-hydroxy-6-hydroxymethyldihydropteridine diphosphokinase / dihydropteroate synthase
MCGATPTRTESDVPISIDTRHAIVARAAIAAGADMVNDVSGGTFDPSMLPTVAALGPHVPMVIMHMRGTPQTMQSLTNYNDNDVVRGVGLELARQCDDAERHGIRRWSQMVDPGIGFAKDMDGNLALLQNMGTFRRCLGNRPVVLGTSRKGFIGKLTGVTSAEQRDPGTMASCVAARCLEVTPSGQEDPFAAGTILRVHNVRDCCQAVQVMDAIMSGAAAHRRTT